PLRAQRSTLFPYTTLFRSKRCFEVATREFLIRFGKLRVGLGKRRCRSKKQNRKAENNYSFHVCKLSSSRRTSSRSSFETVLAPLDRKSTRLNSSHQIISYA